MTERGLVLPFLYSEPVFGNKKMAAMPPLEDQGEEQDALDAFSVRCGAALDQLFDAARSKQELHFAMALNPEMRGSQDGGWSTARESVRAAKEYVDLLNRMPDSTIKVRIALSLYANLSEASGLYEVVKNMLRVASGEQYVLSPFQHLVRTRAKTGNAIAPNANRVMKDIIGHAVELKMDDFKDVILEAFDPDLRHGYAHADYIVWGDEIRLPRRNGGTPRVVTAREFKRLLDRALFFFQILREKIFEGMCSYTEPRHVIGRMGPDMPLMENEISYVPDTGFYSIRGKRIQELDANSPTFGEP